MYTRVLVKFIHNFFLTLIFSFWLHSSFSWLQYKRNYLCIVQVVKYICVDVMTVIPSLLFSNTLIVSTPSSRSVSVLKRWPWQIVARGTWHERDLVSVSTPLTILTSDWVLRFRDAGASACREVVRGESGLMKFWWATLILCFLVNCRHLWEIPSC